ncbi:MAG: ubiquinol-cytochrome c reductase iron-sulfur subunit [Gammaproteobacteria bacterium]|nr:ubiquinol-cytochrome c reductase iron-sulfur subunit [Gammaproteobacteria bacterium]
MSTEGVIGSDAGLSFSTDKIDHGRRRVLIGLTSVVGAAGVGAVAVPFLSSMQPSARARAAGAPVEVDISKLEIGQKLTVEWRGKPVWIVRRDQKILDDLAGLSETRADPDSQEEQQPGYAQNPDRSIKSEYLVVVGICTHLGCSPTYVKSTDPHELGKEWKGGFFCPCHGSRFDLAGRVVASVPAPTNLVVPPHSYVSDTRVLIGVDQPDTAQKGVA